MARAGSSEWSWGWVIVVSKFVVLLLDSGIAKSFGVLIPTMVERLESDYATVGLICSLPATLMYLLCYVFDVIHSFTKVFIIIGFIHAAMVVHIFIVAVLIKRRRRQDVSFHFDH
eukprot:XP_011667258.1 PREDICTED: uncharacterized protein LOC105439688 [Strongylocentrotus purpuratus]